MTVGELLQKWLTESAIPNTARSTSNQYERITKLHVTPKVGRVWSLIVGAEMKK
jgi:hypothetical protein